MSTKVYVAYKVKHHVARNHKTLWKWVRATLHHGEKEVQKVLRNTYKTMMPDVKTDNDEFQRLQKEHGEIFARMMFCHDLLTQQFHKSALSHERRIFDFDVNIAIRELDGDLYVIPYADMLMAHTLDFLKKDKNLVDFAYWDNSDPPKAMRRGAGHRRWRARAQVWEQIDQRGWRDFLLISVCDFSKFEYLDPWLDIIQKKQKPVKAQTAAPPEAAED